MRFLHTADWHLGRIFQGVSLTEDQAFVLEQLVEIVARAQPDAVVLAGDVYDRAVPPPEAVRLFDDVMARIVRGLDVPVLAIAGNHDGPERVDYGSRLLEARGLHVRGVLRPALEPVVLLDEHGPVAFSLLPFAEPAVVREQLLEDLPHRQALSHGRALAHMIQQARARLPAGVRSVCVAHAAVVGAHETESERPLWVAASGYAETELFAGFHYTALGHFHTPQTVSERPCVEYAGSLLKYSFAEAGTDKSVTLVDLDARGQVRLERIPLRPRHDVQCVAGTFEELLERLPEGACAQDYLRVTLADKEPVLDAMARLRRVYPNCLHVEQPQLYVPSPDARARREQIGLDDAELFAAFFEEMAGAPLTDEESACYRDVVASLDRREREKAA